MDATPLNVVVRRFLQELLLRHLGTLHIYHAAGTVFFTYEL